MSEYFINRGDGVVILDTYFGENGITYVMSDPSCSAQRIASYLNTELVAVAQRIASYLNTELVAVAQRIASYLNTELVNAAEWGWAVQPLEEARAANPQASYAPLPDKVHIEILQKLVDYLTRELTEQSREPDIEPVKEPLSEGGFGFS